MITIVVVDDHHVVRQGLRGFLETEPDFEIVGEAASGLEAGPLVEQLRRDVLIVDLLMPDVDGFEVIKQVVAQWPQTRVIVLSMYSDETSVQKAFGSGAVGYALKDSTASELSRGIREVMAGRRYLAPPLSDLAIEAFIRAGQRPVADEYDTLTPREQEVLALAARGLNNTEVAAKLSISPRTAETHRLRMMHKLGLHSQTELVRYALRRGILELGE